MEKDVPDDVLCCCEYLDRHGETNHILAFCCNCEELDNTFESVISGGTVPDQQVSTLVEDVLDRLRIPNPFGGGAQRIDHLVDLTVLPPIVLLPLAIFLSSLSPILTLLVSFVIAPVGVFCCYRSVLRHKKRTQFFMSWALTSFVSMYTLMAFVVYPEGVISQMEFSALTLLFTFFHLSYFRTKQGAGSVSRDSTAAGQIDSAGTHQRRRRSNASPDKQHRDFCGDPGPLENVEGVPPGTNRCKICDIPRPPRAGHCRICGDCFHRLDHHCVWLDCCIGRDNHGSFVLCLLLFIIGCFWGSLRVIVILFGREDDPLLVCLEIYAIRRMAIIFVSALYVLGSGVAVSFLLLHQLWLISHNWTFRERRLARIARTDIRLQELDRGFLINWKNFIVGTSD